LLRNPKKQWLDRQKQGRLAEDSEEGFGLNRKVVTIMMMMIIKIKKARCIKLNN
jgi:hypothetical protein